MPKPNFETCKQCCKDATDAGESGYEFLTERYYGGDGGADIEYDWDELADGHWWQFGKYVYYCPACCDENLGRLSLYSNDNVPSTCPYLLQHMEAERAKTKL